MVGKHTRDKVYSSVDMGLGDVEKPLPEKWEESRNKIGDLILRFETKKNEVAKLRDDLRYIAEEATEIVDSIDDGVEGMEEAIESFKHAIDDMSRYI